MNFVELNDELNLSVKEGEIRRIVLKFLNNDNVLTARTRKYAENWLDYSNKDASLQENGELTTHIETIRVAVNNYCKNFINEKYSGILPKDFTALRYLSEHDDEGDFESEGEFLASGEIYKNLGNYVYVDDALNAIYSENW